MTSPSKRIIFENEFVEALCITWKRDRDFRTLHLIARQLSSLVDSIIRGSRYGESSSFQDIRNELSLQMPKWIEKWIPGNGKFYTYVSRCIQNACLSFVTKEATYRGRYVSTEAPLDSLNPDKSFYEPNMSGLDNGVLKQALEEIPTRWREESVNEFCRVCVKAIMRNRAVSRRKFLIEVAYDAYGIEADQAKFLIDWCTGCVRSILLERYAFPVSELDLLIANEKFSWLPDLVNQVGVKNVKKLLAVFAGCTIRFPSASSIQKASKMARAVQRDPWDKEAHKERAESHFANSRTALANISEGILEEAPLFPNGSTGLLDHIGD